MQFAQQRVVRRRGDQLIDHVHSRGTEPLIGGGRIGEACGQEGFCLYQGCQ
jgi:hypothetical protein